MKIAARFPTTANTGRWFRQALTFGLMALWFTVRLTPQESPGADLTVHEWGTFTSIAGPRGQAVEWTTLPGGQSDDLPDFVEHLVHPNFKGSLIGTIRMETPVLYFYSQREATVSVKVAFSQGLITEWYPHASHVEPHQINLSLPWYQASARGIIAWNDITVSPSFQGEFPRENSSSRYYVPRETSSTPLRVKTVAGEQQEKFLFYRGVSSAELPLSARLNADGTLEIKSLSDEDIPALVYFERRGDRVGFQVGDGTSETVMEPPSLTGNMDSLCADLEQVLIGQGLFDDEARAMVATWRDSWFEEGSRLIYIVPRGFVDKVLPLTIDPVPEQLLRVFVGRMEIVTPATIRAVELARKNHDEAVLKKYARFLDPILRIEWAEANHVSSAN
jgi:hypothetical protein